MKLRGKFLDEFPVIKRPRGITVEHNNRITFPFLYVMVVKTTNIFKVAFKWKQDRTNPFHLNEMFHLLSMNSRSLSGSIYIFILTNCSLKRPEMCL